MQKIVSTAIHSGLYLRFLYAADDNKQSIATI